MWCLPRSAQQQLWKYYNFLQKGNLDLRGAEAAVEPYEEDNPWGIRFIIRLMLASDYQELKIGCVSEQQAKDWKDKINRVAAKGDLASATVQTRQQETEQRISQELSNLVVYFQCVNFKVERPSPYEISSFPESKMERHIQTIPKALIDFHRIGFSRVYPKATRVDSSNYNPVPMWNHGCQMVSLNYQTGGDNGLNPTWCHLMGFKVSNPECALIRFVVGDDDSLREPSQIGHATYPVLCLREGFRSVPLKNHYSEEIELASLLIHLKIEKINETVIKDKLKYELLKMIEEAEKNNDKERVMHLRSDYERRK
ncbi:1-phosphatidylinositol 4,5-bisphosphate phosphodiesterase gamma-1-like isoform X4 [Portunus trituberculatus]|uniref:1-phosphatidylinositol 4,5-bisphosphate phosphodiesterase gamma-1-like isoform X4 n=1 Tax=Portunus trituberculatus TaxID=210409 RepID=UPI001E1CE11E|nr:1-phosphatidylinositol 4,5-bisphosphate phosphodiesterase gamma-1-like isoform X4 [Portunus trituberculatus]